MDHLTGRPRALLLAGSVAAVAYSNFLLDVVLSPDHDWFAVVSELEVPGQPTATVLRWADVGCAALTLAILPWVRAALPDGARWRSVTTGSVATFAVAGALAAAVPLPCTAAEVCGSPGQQLQRWVHDGLSVLSAGALFVSAGAVALGTRHRGPTWLRWAAVTTFVLGGVVGTVLFTWFGARDSASWETGASQRLQLVVMSAWIFCLALLAARAVGSDPRETGRRRPRKDPTCST